MDKHYTLVTGGTTGIGLATAHQLIKEGRNIIITGQNPDRVESAADQLNCMGFVADSENLSSIQGLAQTLKNQGISLQGVVLNAGIFLPQTFLETTNDEFDKQLNINTKGVFFTLQFLLPLLTNPCSVVYVSSIVADKGFENCAVYAASKAASEAFIRVANIELANKGIRINTIRPGVTETPIQQKAGMNQAQQNALFSSLDSTALGRVLAPTDHSRAISFLLSDATLAMRNTVIQIDGGYCL